MFDAATIERNQARMQSARSNFDSLCGELAALIMPEAREGWHGTHYSQGVQLTNQQYDEYGAQAHADGTSVFEQFTMPRGQKWQKIRIANDRIMESVVNAQWLEGLEDLIFMMRNDPKSGFVSNIHQSAESLLAFWGQSMWVDKRVDDYGRFAGISYQSEAVSGIWIDRDAEGNVMRVHRKVQLSGEALVRKFGDEAPKLAREAMAQDKPRRDDMFDIIHVIERNPNMIPGRADMAGKPWIGCYFSVRGKEVFKTGGYRTLRRIVSVFRRAPSETYGRSNNMQILPALRASQVIMQDRVLATELAVKRPLLSMDDELDQGVIDMSPWGVTYGGLDEAGREKLKPMMEISDLSAAGSLHAEIRQVIDRANFRDLMQINREIKTHVSVARTMEEIAEKGTLLSPLARQEQEWFAPMLDAELDILWEAGWLDDMPPDIERWVAEGGGLNVVYDNDLSRMQQANEAIGYLRTAEQVSSLAAAAPQVVDMFVREYPLERVIPGLGKVNGIPASWRATDEEKQAMDEAKAQQAQVQQLLQAAPIIAETTKNLAAAEGAGVA